MERHHGLGLRAQILLALSAAFLLSFTALGVTAVSLARRAQEIERVRRVEAAAEALAVALAPDARSSPSPEALARLVGRADMMGIALISPNDNRLELGNTRGAATASTLLPNGDTLSLWASPLDPEATSPLGGLLRLYLLMTAIGILLVTYVALTRLIVRPVENLTVASERLSGGTQLENVPVAGAAELARLALSFNRMAGNLREEKLALEQRLKELERTTRELKNTQDQLIRSEKLAGVGRLAAGIAHEIGNPLAAVLGLVELLDLGGLSKDEEVEFLRRIRSETERIHRTIRELLDYARTSPEQSPSHEHTALTAVVDEAVKLVTPQKDLRGIMIERRFADVPEVRAPAHELTQIVLNLLLNAADAVGGEGSILVEVDEAGDRVRLSVSDSGPGIPEAIRDKLFEPFVTTKPAGKGTGLGLAVCQSLVERLGGSIRAENRAHGGARFVVELQKAGPNTSAGSTR
jgi:two-component system NtrC family sensor kinase